MPAGANLADLRADHVPFWVRIYDISFNRWDKTSFECVAGKIGSVLDIDRSGDGLYGRYA